MPQPTKTVEVLKSENKSHRTKAELSKREEAEKALESGDVFKERIEVKNNKIAHKEYQRIAKIFKNIGKNDALYEGIINRYALLYAECLGFENTKCAFEERNNKLLEDNISGVITDKEYSDQYKTLHSIIISLDKQIMAKRKMMLDIEKENVMTIAAALRSIPKKAVPEALSENEASLFGDG